MKNAGSDCDAHGDSSTPGSHKEHASADSHQDQSPVEQPSANIIFDTDPMFFSPDEKLKAGFARETEAGTTTYLCMYCNAVYENSIALKMHVRVYHMPVLVYDNGQGTAETRYRMGIKLQHTTSNEMCTTEKPYACLFCPSAYKLQSSLQFHFRENHSPHKPYPCQECKESFRRTIELSRHRLYRCPLRKPQVVQPKR